MTCRFILAGSVCLVVCYANPAFSYANDILPDWDVSGEVLGSYETYRNYGDDGSSPYNEIGGQSYISQDLNFSRQISDYESINGRFSGLYNNSNYRSSFENEYIVEQLALSWEKGDGAIPFAVDVGDYYASFSSRTLQTALKGGRVELQPASKNWQHSIVALSGYSDNVYRIIKPEQNYYMGTSWLAGHESFGSWIANAVYNFQDIEASDSGGSDNRKQSVYSLATDQEFSILKQEFNFEAEIALLDGKPQGSTTDETDKSYFIAVDGSYGKDMQYRTSFEQNGEHFSPAGGSVTANKQDIQSTLSLRLFKQMQVNINGQWLESNYESLDPTHADTYGVTLIDSITYKDGENINVRASAQTTDSHNESKSSNSVTHNAGLSLSTRINEQWNINGSTRWRYNRNRVTSDTSTSRDITINLDRQIDIANWTGVVSPGFTVSAFNAQGDGDYTSTSPYFSASLSNGPHSFNANYRLDYTDQDVSSNNVSQIQQQTASVRYSYDQGNFVLSTYGDSYDRRPNKVDNTHAYRFGVQLSYPFNRPAVRTANAYEQQSDGVEYADINYLTDFERLWLLDNQTIQNITAMLKDQSYNNIQTRGKQVDVAGIFIPKINSSQHMIFDFKADKKLDAIALTFTPLQSSSAVLKRDYQNILDELIKTLGQPIAAYERGEFTSDLIADLAENKFKRIIEWKTADGLYRFGVPYRLDGQIVFELQKRVQMPNQQNNMWSITE